MASFSSASGTLWHKASVINELVSAYNQRRSAVGSPGSALTSISVGADVQAAAYWANLQTTIASLATYYVAHSGSRPNYQNTLYSTSIKWASTGAFWTSVVGNSAGPRRLTGAGSWTYGTCQSGDRLSSHIVEDLQQALRYLRYIETTTTNTFTSKYLSEEPDLGQGYWSGDARGTQTLAVNEAYQKAIYDAMKPDSSISVKSLWYCQKYNSGSNPWVAHHNGDQGRLSITIPAEIPRPYSFDAYFRPTSLVGIPPWETPTALCLGPWSYNGNYGGVAVTAADRLCMVYRATSTTSNSSITVEWGDKGSGTYRSPAYSRAFSYAIFQDAFKRVLTSYTAWLGAYKWVDYAKVVVDPTFSYM